MDLVESCDLCGDRRLTLAYRPPTSVRRLAIYVCEKCGSVQSLPRVDRAPSRQVAVSCGAAWGNLRYGKGFRTEAAISFLKQTIDLKAVRHCLDVGANRGSFVLRLREIAPQAEITAVEPDGCVVESYADNPGIDLIVGRIEGVKLPPQRFDLVYCSHTLEHLRSPRQTLKKIAQALAPGGTLFLEVPHLHYLHREDLLEEWFLDKHLYHFSPAMLTDYLRLAGLRSVSSLPDPQTENITVIAQKNGSALARTTTRDERRAQKNLELLARYRTCLEKNQLTLKRVCRTLEETAAGRRLVIWGAGRIFDSLVQYGGLRVHVLAGVVDRYLADLVGEVHGLKLARPRDLPGLAPDLVVVASRCFLEEIRQEVAQLMPGCQVTGITEWLETSSFHQL
ncbi:MAG: class I SAM-dependent methyltransferase [Desulfobaccales bacterium]